jgi:ribonuclease Z
MPISRTISEIRLVNGSTGDPALFVDYPGRDDALLFDAGDNGSLGMDRLGDLGVVFISHHHVDHFIGLDRIVRANLDRDKTLRVFGPEGTIRKVYDRIKSYEYPFFPFQKVVLEVTELLIGRRLTARLECAQRFPEPEVEESPWDGPVIFATEDLEVEAAHVDHTVPCLAFALVERPGYHPDPARLAGGPLRPGAWIARALKLLREGASGSTPVAIDGGRFSLAALRDMYFVEAEGSRIAYVTDTAWNIASRPALLRLAHGARRLYCDSFYAEAQAAQAERYRHMTAPQAAAFAAEAGAEELVLIHFSARYKGQYETLIAEARATFPGATADLGTT